MSGSNTIYHDRTFVLCLDSEPGTDTLWHQYWLIHTDGSLSYDALLNRTMRIPTSEADYDPSKTKAAEDARIEQALLAIKGVVRVDKGDYPMVCLKVE